MSIGGLLRNQHVAPLVLENKENFLQCRRHGMLVENRITVPPPFSSFEAQRIFAAPSSVSIHGEELIIHGVFLQIFYGNYNSRDKPS